MTMMRELNTQLPSPPTLVVAPVGVGSFAQAVVSNFKRPGSTTSVVSVEPDTAACFWKSLKLGEMQSISTTKTIMAGLDCGTPSSIAWPFLVNGVDASLTVSDFEAHEASMFLAGQGVPAGPCGGASLAALYRLEAADREALGIDKNSVIVLFCTEGSRSYATPHCVLSDDPVTLTQTLVQINSASPSLGSVPGPGETSIACYITAWFQHRDIETHWIEPTPGRPSVVAVARGSGGGKSLMLNGHIDTVTLMGYEKDPLSGEIVNGKLYGRGAADMKAGVAAMMIALANAKKLNLRGDIVFAGVADEEANSIGTEDVLRAGWRTDAAIVTEPTDLEILHAHKGFVWLDVTVHGQASHGSRADLGVDAITKAGYFLAELDRHGERIRSGPGDPVVGTGTIHAGLISGGEETSSYPAECKISIERRTIPGETPKTVEKEIQDIIDKLTKEVPAFEADVKVTFSRDPHSTPLGHPLTKLVADVVTKSLGHKASIVGAPYWTNCGLLAAAGIPSLLWGPKGEGLHAKEEWVDTESIEKVAEALTDVARQFCN